MHEKLFAIVVSIIFLLGILLLVEIPNNPVAEAFPSVLGNTSLKVEQYFPGKPGFHPVSMAFIGQDDILLTEKLNGKVNRIINGNLLPEPLVDVPVANKVESGMLGIATKKTDDGKTLVFVYYTLSGGSEDSLDVYENVSSKGSILERYELVNNTLVDPKVLLYINSSSLPPLENGGQHVGGKVKVGPDGNIYVQVGDGMNQKTFAQNYQNGTMPNGTGGILRVSEEGFPVDPPIDIPSMKYYYSYGMRNGFGMDFDPQTGWLWDAEVGSTFGDEINLVFPGFNSGWSKIHGPSNFSEAEPPSGFNYIRKPKDNPVDLLSFNGSGTYSEPKFAWKAPVTPTSIKFVDSDKLGAEYENDLLVGEFSRGQINQSNIYRFNLNDARDAFDIGGKLEDNYADSQQELENVTFATGFEIITDIQVGPDGYPYVLTFDWGYENPSGKIYRIVPITQSRPACQTQDDKQELLIDVVPTSRC